MKIRVTIAALAFGLALASAAAPAQASDRTILINLRLNLERPPSCAAEDWFGLAFDMVSLGGKPLGSGQSCVHSVVGCETFRPFCRQTVDSTFTLDFSSGSITAPMTLREILPTESSFIQRGEGVITSGTGEFARARGRVEGGGVGAFTDSGPVTALVYAVRLKRTP
jgi:hypothetical protein